MTRPSLCHAAATAAFGALFAPLAAAQAPTPPPADCSTLATLAIPNTNLLSAAMAPA
jgi:hypothetical protein